MSTNTVESRTSNVEGKELGERIEEFRREQGGAQQIFSIRYTWGPLRQCGHTVASGANEADAIGRFRRENPHVVAVEVVR